MRRELFKNINRSFLLKNATVLLKNTTISTKCFDLLTKRDTYYKLARLFKDASLERHRKSLNYDIFQSQLLRFNISLPRLCVSKKLRQCKVQIPLYFLTLGFLTVDCRILKITVGKDIHLENLVNY